MPANHRAWPEGSTFYHYDKIYDRRNLGYRGPSFGLPPMPDQYALLALQRRELAERHRPPLFAEVDLISSHAPWTRIPRLIPWDDVGDGSIFDRIPAEESTQAALFGDAERARAAYGRSIEYSLSTLFSFVQRYGDDDLVLVVLGDHQPATLVTGQGASHDVPISVIAHDPKVIDQIAGWGWQDGMLPSPQAPVWPMDAFRDRFLTAFGSRPRHEAGRPRAVRPGTAPRARVGVRPRRVRRAGELHDRRRDPGPGGAGRRRPRGHGAGPVLRRRRARAASSRVSWAATTWAWTPARAPSPIARERAGDLPCRFAVAQVPPLPAGSFDVVLLLETMLAFEDKDALVREIAAALRPGGRFAFTLEEGPPLTAAERAAMPDADTVWLTPLDELATSLERAGLVVTWQEDRSRPHRAMAQALAGAFAADAADIAAQIGRQALDELLAAHRLWVEWLDEGRVRKLALVAERA